MKLLKRLPLFLLAIVLLIPLGPAYADAAPPMNPPGGDVSPEGGTEVQMVAEQVTIDFRQFTDDRAAVSAWFLFHNTGSTDEHLKVRFPLNGDEQGQWDANGNMIGTFYPLIQDFTASLGSQPLPTQVVKDDDPNAELFFLGGSAVLYWAVFDMDFPVGSDVKLTVTYTTQPTTDASYANITYLLSTGAGWKGPIGKVDVIARFPYILNDYNLPEIDNYNQWDAQLGRQTTVLENELRFHYENLEPTQDNNVGLWMLQPHLWQEILRRRTQVIGYPDDAGAWAALSRAYAAAGIEHHGMFANPDLARLYIQATERALTLDPKNIALHAEFASHMMDAAMIASDGSYDQALALNEIATVLSLDPTNADMLALLDTLKQYYSFDPSTLPTPGPFPAYTSSAPTLEPTPFPSLFIVTEMPSSTPRPSATPGSTLTPSPTTTAKYPAGPRAGGNRGARVLVLLALVLLGAAGYLNWRSVRKK